MIELRIAGGDLATLIGYPILREQVYAVFLDAEERAERHAAVHRVLGGVVEVRRAGMLDRGGAVTGPRQAVVVAGQVVASLRVFPTPGAQSLDVENVLVAHVRLQPLGRLAGVPDGPATLVDFVAQHILDRGLV